MQVSNLKAIFGIIFLLAFGTTYAQTKPRVVVIPLADDINSQQVNDLAAQVDAIAAQVSAIAAQVSNLEANKPFVVEGPVRGQINITDSRTVVNQVSVTAPSDGQVFAIASGTGVENTAGEDIRCALSTNPTPASNNAADSIWEASGATTNNAAGEGDAGVLIRSDSFAISAGQTATYYFSCRNTVASGESQVWGPKIQAIFIPN